MKSIGIFVAPTLSLCLRPNRWRMDNGWQVSRNIGVTGKSSNRNRSWEEKEGMGEGWKEQKEEWVLKRKWHPQKERRKPHIQMGKRVLFFHIKCDQRRWGGRWWELARARGRLGKAHSTCSDPFWLGAQKRRWNSKANHDVKVECLRAADRPTWKSTVEICLGWARFLLVSLAAPLVLCYWPTPARMPTDGWIS